MKEGSEEIGKEKRKRTTVASTFRNSEFNNNSSPWTKISSSFIYVSMLVYISNPYYLLSHSLRA